MKMSSHSSVTGIGRDKSEIERLGWGWQKEAGSWFQRQGEAYWKERSVICGEDDASGWGRV